MSNVPENLKYTKDHEWIKAEGETARIGITDHAQSSLGDITFVESVKAASDLYMPVSCEVVEVNEALEGAPENVNDDPYGEGWIICIKMTDAAEMSSLLDASAYKELL